MKITINGEMSEEHTHRNSSFELLRILCIFGIVSMHIFGAFYGTAQGINQVLGVLINSVFNMCVSLFMLISGYFGINGSVKKYLKLELEVLFYSVLSLLIMVRVQGNLNLEQIIQSVVPVMSRKYWYITTYMLLMIFSQYINQTAEKLNKITFEKLLLLMFIVFSLIPTIIGFHVMNDGGKGLMNMLLMYWIGRYIRLYGAEQTNNKKIAGIGVGVITLGFVLNMGLSMCRGGKGVNAPFARDCSSIIVVGSVAVFLLFRNYTFTIKAINRVAKHVLAVYLLEASMRTVLGQFFDLSVFSEKRYLFILIGIYAIVTLLGCMLVDILRVILFGTVENKLCDWGSKKINMMWYKKS